MTNGPVRQPTFAPAEAEAQVVTMKSRPLSQPEDQHVVRSSKELPFLLDGDMLKVTNNDNRTAAFHWAGKMYALEPGETNFVIFEALVDALGDPRSKEGETQRYDDGNGDRGIVMERHFELTRMLARYAIKGEMIEEIPNAAPKVVVETLGGQRVSFPALNPNMMEFPTTMVNERAVNSDVTRMIEANSAENAALAEKVSRLEEMLDREVRLREGVEPASD